MGGDDIEEKQTGRRRLVLIEGLIKTDKLEGKHPRIKLSFIFLAMSMSKKCRFLYATISCLNLEKKLNNPQKIKLQTSITTLSCQKLLPPTL